MSNVGKTPIKIPRNISIIYSLENNTLHIRTPSKTNIININPLIYITIEDNIKQIRLSLKDPKNTKKNKMIWGTERSNLYNLISGLTQKFYKTIKLNGIGYKASHEENKLILTVGFSHLITKPIKSNVTCLLLKNTEILLSSNSKSEVTQYAQTIRNLKKPDAYKGKGICYQNEILKLKEGKKK